MVNGKSTEKKKDAESFALRLWQLGCSLTLVCWLVFASRLTTDLINRLHHRGPNFGWQRSTNSHATKSWQHLRLATQSEELDDGETCFSARMFLDRMQQRTELSRFGHPEQQ